MPMSQAQQKMLSSIQVTQPTERIAVTAGLHRIVAQTLVSATNNPPYDNSAMDGYALSETTNAEQGYKCIVTVYAGQAENIILKPGQCARIMTGAQVPKGTVAIIMQEQVICEGDRVYPQTTVSAGNNIRLQGEDFSRGQTLLSKGHIIEAQDIALMIAAGISELEVYKPLKVALLTTGSELVAAGQPLKSGQIYDSNRPMLHAFLSQEGYKVVDYGIIEDDPDAIQNCLLCAADECDAIVTSGGVSVGKADFTGQIIAKIGQVNFFKVAIKPGKPFTFGHIKQALFFGLPGNPVSAAVTYQQLAKLGLQKASGADLQPQQILRLPLRGSLPAGKQRLEYLRARFIYNNNQVVAVSAYPQQGSGRLTSLVGYECYILLKPQQPAASDGDLVEVLLK